MDYKGIRWAIRIVVIAAAIIYILIFRGSRTSHHYQIGNDHLNFRNNKLYFTKHARCRMDCRYIDESEVKEILSEGEINNEKSEPDANPCPKYAVEGITHDQQHVRIIVGDCKDEADIITVIDLDHDFECDCK